MIPILLPLSIFFLSLFQLATFVAEHVDLSQVLRVLPSRPLGDDYSQHCGSHEYAIEVLSLDPLVLYLDKFISDEEVCHLLDLT